jgi:hypothetical protein
VTASATLNDAVCLIDHGVAIAIPCGTESFMPEPTLELLQSLMLQGLNEQREMRREVGDQRSLLLALAEQGQRLDRRMGDLERRMGEMREDIELMLKAELMGRMGNFEAQVGHRLDALADRVATLETHGAPAS